jgi:septum formation protein
MRIVLASTSPRRIDLMKQVGIDALVRAPLLEEEKMIRGESPRRMVARLAREKAESLAKRVGGELAHALIVSADTTVVAPDRRTVLNKPSDRAEAERMLAKLAGRTHRVLTGYCLLEVRDGRVARRRMRVVESGVTMRKLSRAEIARYVATGEPMDKAGAYAAQGIGMGLIEKIAGSYTNVVGLPMAQLLKDLQSEFGVPFLGGGDGG